MLDQMFTAENFRRVFDIENRKGLDVAGRYFPHLDAKTLAVHDKVAEIRAWRKNAATVSATVFEAGEGKLKSELAELKADKRDGPQNSDSSISSVRPEKDGPDDRQADAVFSRVQG